METIFTIYYRSNAGGPAHPNITYTLTYRDDVAQQRHVDYINSQLAHIRQYGAVGGGSRSQMTYIPPDSIIAVEISGYLPENFFPGPLRS